MIETDSMPASSSEKRAMQEELTMAAIQPSFSRSTKYGFSLFSSPSSPSSSAPKSKKKGSSKDRKAVIQRFSGSLSVFKWTVKHLYLTTEFQESIKSTPHDRDRLLAYYKQATKGPNKKDPPNCLFSFASAFTGATAAADTLTAAQWELWKNLGDMPREEASDLFLELLSVLRPEFLETKVDQRDPDAGTPVKDAEGILVQYTIREIIFRYAAIRIQAIVRSCLYRKFAFAKLAQRYNSDTIELLAMLVKGINVSTVPAAGGKDSKRRVLTLRMAASLATSKLYLSGTVPEDEEEWLWLSDVADIRSVRSFIGLKILEPTVAPFVVVDTRHAGEDRCTIIASERKFDIVLSKSEKSRAWFVRTFQLLIDKCLSPEDLRNRGRFVGAKLRFNPIQLSKRMKIDAKRVWNLLDSSFGVEEYVGLAGTTASESDGKSAAKTVSGRNQPHSLPWIDYFSSLGSLGESIGSQTERTRTPTSHHTEVKSLIAPVGPMDRIEYGWKVEVNRNHRMWNPGKVTRDHGDGTFDILYDNGESDVRVKKDIIRLLGGDGDCIPDGLRELKVMSVDWTNKKIKLESRDRGRGEVKQMSLDDICEVRCGKISTLVDNEGLDRALSDRMLTIVSSERVFRLVLSSKQLRNRLARSFILFLAEYQKPGAYPAIHGSASRHIA